MNQQVILNRIRTLLARFQEEVKIDNANGEFSINLHAENLLLKLLNTAYGWDLQNVNYEEGKTFAAIDLRDEARKVTVQITSSGTVDKVVHTLQECAKNGYDVRYEHLYFYFLKGMDKKVKIDSPRINKNLGKFRPECVHFLDHTGFYLELNRINDLEKCRQILAMLEEQFSDLPLSSPRLQKKTFTNKDLIIPFTQGSASGSQGNTYVPRHDLLDKIAECYDSQTGKKRIVFLSGMGGCGKSELARAYADVHKEEYEDIFWLTCSDGETPELMSLFSAAKTLRTVEKSDVADFSSEVLIIVDNCNMDDPGFLHDLTNGTGNADILVTTRLPIMGDYDDQMISVESDDPEGFACAVFEKNYCKKPRWGSRKDIGDHEKSAVLDICREVQCNTMIVSLIGVRLREYNNLTILECAEKIRGGVSTLKGRITYPKDQDTRSEEMKEILCFLFSDILNYPLTDAQREVLTLLSLAPASWFDMDFIFLLAGDGPQGTEHEYAAKTLLNFGWLQGTEDRMTIHPLIAEAIEDESIIIKDSVFFESVLRNYLALPDRYLGTEQFLANKILILAGSGAPEIRIAVMLLINHGGYKKLFSELRPDVNAAYFVRVDLQDRRSFEYRDLEKNDTCMLTEFACPLNKEESAELLKVYNTGVPYALDTDVAFHGAYIKEIPAGLCRHDYYLSQCILVKDIEFIEASAFEGCSHLTGSLHLPDSLTSIGNRAFYGCSGLTGGLHLPDSLISIGDSAFFGCSGLNGELHLPDSLTSIGDLAFFGSSGLNGELHLPDSLTSIGQGAFLGCSGLNGELHLPDSLTSIGYSAFFGCSGLTGGLLLPDGLTSIGDSAFSGCSGLTGELHLPDSLTSIGNSAFEDCVGLNGGLLLPDSLTSIGDSAFSGCSGLTGELHLPNSLTSIGHRAFLSCIGLTGELHLPDSLTSIGHGAFEGCIGLTGELHLPDGLTSIEDRAFFRRNGLTGELHLPDDLTSIWNRAFKGCSRLTGELHLPDSLTNIGDSAFEDCVGLTGELHLPDNLISIEDRAFFRRNDLTGELHLPDNLINIGDSAFKRCTGLTGGLHLPNSLTRIGDSAFEGCSGLTGELHLPNSLTSIGDSAFEGCTGLTGELHLPNSLTRIEDSAFKRCTGLTGELHLPNSLTSIGNSAFEDCVGLNGELHLPNSLISIGNLAFRGCTGLTGKLHLPASLTTIEAYAFEGCTGLNGELHLPDSLTSIGIEAFEGCTGLTGNLHLPDSLTSIGDWAFRGCSGLVGNLYLPATLAEIGNHAFDKCNGIIKIIFNNPNTKINGTLIPFSSVIICGYKHSTAEKYALENGLVFEELIPNT